MSKAAKKKLFSRDVNMYYPQWAPLGPSNAHQPSTRPATLPMGSKPAPALSGPCFMYLSGTGLKKGRSVWITDLDGKKLKLASLPDQVMHAYTGWTWLNEKKIRIFHIGKAGLIIVEINRDATETRRGHLSRKQLFELKKRADLRGLIKYLNRQSQDVSKILSLNLGQAKKLRAAYKQQIQEIQAQLDKLGPPKISYQIE